MPKHEHFGSRLGMMLAMLGMAVGTGNIWRFPRIAAQNGGGEFIIAWVVFLGLWSIPLILLEFGMGHKVRSGPVKAFVAMLGPRWAWMGAFAAFAACAIMYYYSVVAGWTFRYALASLTGEIPESTPGAFWTRYSTSWWPVITHGFAIGLATLVVARGVKAIERVTRILMPILILLILVLTVRAVTLPGAGDGLRYLFTVDWPELLRGELWIQALTQNAWDTGAGWGIVLCYAAYLREKEDTTLNAVVLPIANNGISLLAGMMVLCTVFSVVPQLVSQVQENPEALAAYPELVKAVEEGDELTPQLMQDTIFGAGNEGLTFVWMPQLFDTLPGGRFFMFLFFVALSFAAFTSLVALMEVGARVAIDFGVERRKAIRFVAALSFSAGLPSAISMAFLSNQDWVWSIALMVSGLFFSIAVIGNGIRNFRGQHLNHEHSNIAIGPWWDIVIGVLVPIQAVVLLFWWLIQSWQDQPEGWLDPFAQANVGTVLFQFAIVLIALIALNGWMVRRLDMSD